MHISRCTPTLAWCFIPSLSGDAADGMYFIEDGSVSIRLEQDGGGEVEIAMLNKGQYFGELALVTHRPRAASAYATTDIKIACKCRHYSINHHHQTSVWVVDVARRAFSIVCLFSGLLNGFAPTNIHCMLTDHRAPSAHGAWMDSIRPVGNGFCVRMTERIDSDANRMESIHLSVAQCSRSLYLSVTLHFHLICVDSDLRAYNHLISFVSFCPLPIIISNCISFFIFFSTLLHYKRVVSLECYVRSFRTPVPFYYQKPTTYLYPPTHLST